MDDQLGSIVMVVDLVGSTELFRDLGDEDAANTLREYRRITHEMLTQHGAVEVVDGLGDGALAWFQTASSALVCAISMQTAFALRRDSSGRRLLPVVVGLAVDTKPTGDIEMFGPAVVLATRIAQHASAGEILVSAPVRQLGGDRVAYTPRGEVSFRGVEAPVEVWEVQWSSELEVDRVRNT